MSYAAVQYRQYDLPWTLGEEQEQRFKRVLKGTLGAVLALALVVSVLPVPEPDPAAVEEVPPRFARLILERVEPPPPPPVVRQEPEPLPEPEPEPVVERQITETPPPAPTPERVVEEPPPAPPPENRVEQARERARSAGLLPFAEQLAALRDTTLVDDLAGPQTTASSVGVADGPAVTERSLITSRAGASSGGINTAALSRDTGGTGLAGRATTRVESPVERIAPSDSGGAAGGASEDGRPSRSREEIERVFDQNKTAIYALYTRALRQNPSLAGKVVLRLTIAPDGTVTSCEIVSSELNDPDLEQKLVQRVMLFRFEAKDVAPVTTTKPIDFFPG